MAEEKTYLEITNDPSSARSIVQELIKELRGKDGRAPNRETALAITKLQEAAFWLLEAMVNNHPNP